jgi:hypothetical protein
VLRTGISVAVVLLITGASLIGNSDLATVQMALSKAAYVLFAAIVLTLLGMLIVLYKRKSQLAANDLTVRILSSAQIFM